MGYYWDPDRSWRDILAEYINYEYSADVIDEVLELVEDGVDYCFLPINGVGNNMNAKDASDFAYEIGAHRAVPLHYGLFDDIEPTTFDFEDGLILMPYQPTKL
jgi:L-ascorbate metabolism protein UlaG (beta-lactamase superfamily)